MTDKAGIENTIVDQAGVPGDWTTFDAVIGYIHGRLDERVEVKFIEYVKNGGRLVLLHHSISGGKPANLILFDFLGIALTEPARSREPSTPGGHYAWKDPVEQVIVNLNPDHFITGNSVTWPSKTSYVSSDAPSVELEYTSMVLKGTEAYVNPSSRMGVPRPYCLDSSGPTDATEQLTCRTAPPGTSARAKDGSFTSSQDTPHRSSGIRLSLRSS